MEAYELSLLSEASSADHHVVLSDEADLRLANSAAARVLAVVARVGSPKLVRHC